MQKVSSTRRLCLALLLSQALAVQALVVAWSGAQAAVPALGAFTEICRGAQSGDKPGDPAPSSQHGSHDCLSVCTGGLSAVEPEQSDTVPVDRVVSHSDEILGETGPRLAFTTQVFSARGPPTLV